MTLTINQTYPSRVDEELERYWPIRFSLSQGGGNINAPPQHPALIGWIEIVIQDTLGLLPSFCRVVHDEDLRV